MRVGLVGAGWVTQYHLPAWSKVPDAAVVAICDPNHRAAAARAAAFGIDDVFTAIEDMLSSVRLDVLDVASPRQFHASHVRAGVAHGLAVICQKPLGIDLEEAERLAAEIEGRAAVMVHENWRFRPYYRQLKAWLDQDLVGEIVAVRLDFHSSGMIPVTGGQRPALVRQPFFRTLDRLLVSEVLIHHLDTLRFLLGEMTLESAFLRRSNDEIRGEDGATLNLVQETDGAPVHVSGNLAVHGAPPAPTDQLRIWGARASIHLEGSILRLLGAESQEIPFDPEGSYQAAYDGAIAHFAAELRRGRRFETSPRDNLETLRLVEAAYQAGRYLPGP